MNRFFNIWLFIFCVIGIPFAIAIGLNEDFKFFGIEIQGEEYPYKNITFGIIAAAIFLLGILKASKKWLGLYTIKQKNRFQFHTPLSKERKKRVLLYGVIELVFFLIFAFTYFFFTLESIFISIVLFLIAIEHLLNLIIGIGQNNFGVGLSKKAIIRVDREIDVLYFKGLQKITKHQQTLYFDYVNDLVLHIPLNTIPDTEKAKFFELLEKVNSKDKVYYEGF